jgi:hypothetical protein
MLICAFIFGFPGEMPLKLDISLGKARGKEYGRNAAHKGKW